MTEQFKCLGCGGVYSAVQADGTTYHHACPPIVDPKTGELSEREGHRDETIAVNRRGRELGIVSEGAGIEPARPKGKAEPTWLTALRKRVAKAEEE